MTDTFTKEKRSWTMSRIRSKNTKPELVVRSLLHRMGFRFRINNRSLPGSPDLVLPKFNTAIFVHGCFWHKHDCQKSSTPRSNQAYWVTKLEKNKARDLAKRRQLEELGWKVMVVWECEVLKKPLEKALDIAKVLKGTDDLDYGEILKKKEILDLAAEKSAEYIARADKRSKS